MSPKPIEAARDADLRHSLAAMQRAARRAREWAMLTGTGLTTRPLEAPRTSPVDHAESPAPSEPEPRR